MNIDGISSDADREPWSVRRSRRCSSGPPAAARPTGANSWLLLPVLGQVLVAEVPVLPQLQGCQQHHQSAEAGMPEPKQTVAGIAEDVGRGGQPDAERDLGHLLPALQRNIFKLRKAEYKDADRERIQDDQAAFRVDDFVVRLHGKPW